MTDDRRDAPRAGDDFAARLPPESEGWVHEMAIGEDVAGDYDTCAICGMPEESPLHTLCEERQERERREEQDAELAEMREEADDAGDL